MDFQQFCEQIASAQSSKWTSRQKLLDAFERVLYGEAYAHKAAAFSQELRNPNSPSTSERIPLDDRRAAAQFRAAWILVRDVVGRLWGENARPIVVVPDDAETGVWVQAFMRDAAFWLTLIEATFEGSLGSVAVVLRILGDSETVEKDGVKTRIPKGKGRYHAEIWPAKECQPVFSRVRPNELDSLTRTYVVTDDTLRADGYDVDELEQTWREKRFGRSSAGRSRTLQRREATSSDWVLRVRLDARAETWYEPVPQWLYERSDFEADRELVVDTERSFAHALEETPARWARPLPFRHKNFPDGLCLFEPVIDFQFRIDRTLSQTGRAFDYAGDPQLAWVDEPNAGAGEFGEQDAPTAAGASDVIPVTAKGGAEFVEISGEGLRVAIEIYIKLLIRLAREVGGGSRIDDESKAGTQMSGVAMRLLNSALEALAGILHITLGEKLLVDLLRLAMRMAVKVDVDLPSLPALLKRNEVAAKEPDPHAVIELQWPDIAPPTGQELLFTVQAIKMACADLPEVGPPIIAHKTAVANAAPYFDVQDSENEQSDIVGDLQVLAEARGSEDETHPDQTERDAPGKDATSGDDPRPDA